MNCIEWDETKNFQSDEKLASIIRVLNKLLKKVSITLPHGIFKGMTMQVLFVKNVHFCGQRAILDMELGHIG